jgi:hypothetical protein
MIFNKNPQLALSAYYSVFSQKYEGAKSGEYGG